MISDEIPMRGSIVPKWAATMFAEILGTFFLVLLGDGAVAQYVLLEPERRNFVTVALGYGLALTCGILIAAKASGGHLNPAVTLAFAIIGKCSWHMVAVYWIGQYIGAFVAAATLLGVYADAIYNRFGSFNGTAAAGIFTSFPNAQTNADGSPNDLSTLTLAADQIVGAAILMVVILSATDKRQNSCSSAASVAPLFIGLGLTAIHLSLAYNAGCAINPARDFSPRLLTFLSGSGVDVFTAGNNFFWIPWILPHVGTCLGALVYQFMIAIHLPPEEAPSHLSHSLQPSGGAKIMTVDRNVALGQP